MAAARVIYRIALGMVTVASVFGLCAVQSGSQRLGTLPSDSGRIEYRFTKPGLTGTSEFSWKDRGALFRQDLKNKLVSETILGHGRDLIMLSPPSRVAQRTEVKGTDLWLNATEMPYVTPGAGAGEVVGQGTVLGKPCEIRKLYTTRIWYWEGLPLRMERAASPTMRPLSLVAVRMESSHAAPSGWFEVPASYRITEFPRQPPFPWTKVATAGLVGVLCLVAIGGWAVERAFSPARVR